VRLAWPLLALAALLLSGSAAGAARHHPRHCARSGARDVAADARGRIYVVGRGDLQPWYACLRSRDRPELIDEDSPPNTTLSLPRVTSPYAAAVVDTLDSAPYVSTLHMIDMRTGSERTTLVSGGVADLVLTRFGVAAFMQGVTENEPAHVRRMDRRGVVVDIDSGNIAAGSLAVSPDGRHLYWTKDGVAYGASL
jgi:hypothetical protein